MTIDTSKYFFKKELHTEIAIEINRLATRKHVSVSRWVNNSKPRQTVTYIVHTGERNQYASKQNNVLFQVSEQSSRQMQIMDETTMLEQVRVFLNSIVVDEPKTQQTEVDAQPVDEQPAPGRTSPAVFSTGAETMNIAAITEPLYYIESEYYGDPALCTAAELDQMDEEYNEIRNEMDDEDDFKPANWRFDKNIIHFTVDFVEEWLIRQDISDGDVTPELAQHVYHSIIERYAKTPLLSFNDWCQIVERYDIFIAALADKRVAARRAAVNALQALEK
jgi:hypothetical protein